jgi:hypothetical protein
VGANAGIACPLKMKKQSKNASPNLMASHSPTYTYVRNNVPSAHVAALDYYYYLWLAIDNSVYRKKVKRPADIYIYLNRKSSDGAFMMSVK